MDGWMLDEGELWRLRMIEQQIAGDDPALARALTRFEPVARWRFRAALGTLIMATGGIPTIVFAGAAVSIALVLAVIGLSAVLLTWASVRMSRDWFGLG